MTTETMTPEQIAQQLMEQEFGAHNVAPHFSSGDTVHQATIRRLMIAAVVADRAQPSHDGSLHAAVIRALGERAELVEDGEVNAAASGAQWIEDEPDEFWEEVAGPMLDEIEGKFS